MTAPSLRQQLFRRKPVSAMVAEAGPAVVVSFVAGRLGLAAVVYATCSRTHSRLRTPSR